MGQETGLPLTLVGPHPTRSANTDLGLVRGQRYLPLEPPSKVYLTQSCLESGGDRPEDPPHPHDGDSRKDNKQRRTRPQGLVDWHSLPGR